MRKPKVPKQYPQRVRLLHKQFGGKCQEPKPTSEDPNALCGSKFGLEFAHVKPTGLKGRSRGQTQRYYDIIKNPDAYQLTCKSCHYQRDFGKNHPEKPNDSVPEECAEESHVDVTEQRQGDYYDAEAV